MSQSLDRRAESSTSSGRSRHLERSRSREGASAAGPSGRRDPFSAAGSTGRRDRSAAAGSASQRDPSAAAGPAGHCDPFSFADPFSAVGPAGQREGSAARRPSQGVRSSPARQISRAAGPASTDAGQGASEAPSRKSATSKSKPPTQLRSTGFLETNPQVILENMQINLPANRRTGRPRRPARPSKDEEGKEQRALLAAYSTVLPDHPMTLSIRTEFHLERQEHHKAPIIFRDSLRTEYSQYKDARYPAMKPRDWLDDQEVWKWTVKEPCLEQNSRWCKAFYLSKLSPVNCYDMADKVLND
jgi:hypothetical protein